MNEVHPKGDKLPGQLEYETITRTIKWVSTTTLAAILLFATVTGVRTCNQIDEYKSELEKITKRSEIAFNARLTAELNRVSQQQAFLRDQLISQKELNEMSFDRALINAQLRLSSQEELFRERIQFVEATVLRHAEEEARYKTKKVLTSSRIDSIASKEVRENIMPRLSVVISESIDPLLDSITAFAELSPLIYKAYDYDDFYFRELVDSSYLSGRPFIRSIAQDVVTKSVAHDLLVNQRENLVDLELLITVARKGISALSPRCSKIPKSVVDSLPITYGVWTINPDQEHLSVMLRWYNDYGLIPFDMRCVE